MFRLTRREFMQASATALLLESAPGIASLGTPSSSDAPAAAVRTNVTGRSWTVDNGLVQRDVIFDPKLGLYSDKWIHKVTGTDFLEAARKNGERDGEFSFQLDGHELAGLQESAWEFIGANTEKVTPSGECLALQLRSTKQPIDVTCYYAIYEGHPVIQKWLAITNRSAAVVTLSHLSFEGAAIRPGAPDALQVSGFYASEPREIFLTGRVDEPAVLERNSLTGEGFIAMNGAPGYTKRTEMVNWGEGVQIMYDTDLFPFERNLQPGETFTTAKGAVAFFVDGKGFADPRWLMPSFASQVLTKKGKRYQPRWIYNTWEPFFRGITREITLDLVAAAGRMSMDVFTIDDGWQADYGANAINLHLFPHGLEEIQSAVEKQGMRLGLWVPLAAVSMTTEVYKQHPEWVCKGRDGKPKVTGTMEGSDAVMCLASSYREVAARRISELIGRYN